MLTLSGDVREAGGKERKEQGEQQCNQAIQTRSALQGRPREGISTYCTATCYQSNGANVTINSLTTCYCEVTATSQPHRLKHSFHSTQRLCTAGTWVRVAGQPGHLLSEKSSASPCWPWDYTRVLMEMPQNRGKWHCTRCRLFGQGLQAAVGSPSPPCRYQGATTSQQAASRAEGRSQEHPVHHKQLSRSGWSLARGMDALRALSPGEVPPGSAPQRRVRMRSE